jgi:hypothetical protein
MDTDMFLLPSWNDLNQQRRALRLLGELLDRTQRKNLPPMDWTITFTGTLVGEVPMFAHEVGRRVYKAWADELGLADRAERTDDGILSLRALGTSDGVHVTVKADLNASEDEPGKEP